MPATKTPITSGWNHGHVGPLPSIPRSKPPLKSENPYRKYSDAPKSAILSGSPGTGKTAMVEDLATRVLAGNKPVSLTRLKQLANKAIQLYPGHPDPTLALETQADHHEHWVLLELTRDNLIVHLRLGFHCQLETREHQQTSHRWDHTKLNLISGYPNCFLLPLPREDVTKVAAAIQSNRQWMLRQFHSKLQPSVPFDPFDL